jgi:hypothetical protein
MQMNMNAYDLPAFSALSLLVYDRSSLQGYHRAKKCAHLQVMPPAELAGGSP